MEGAVLDNAKSVLETNTGDFDKLKSEYTTLVEEYEKLLDEARFLTKISDKLEAKLNASNEKLQQFNKELAHEAEHAKQETETVLKKNRKLFEQKTQSETSKNKLQLTLTVMIGLLVVVILLFVYQFLGCKLGLKQGPECAEVQQKVQEDKAKKENSDNEGFQTP